MPYLAVPVSRLYFTESLFSFDSFFFAMPSPPQIVCVLFTDMHKLLTQTRIEPRPTDVCLTGRRILQPSELEQLGRVGLVRAWPQVVNTHMN